MANETRDIAIRTEASLASHIEDDNRRFSTLFKNIDRIESLLWVTVGSTLLLIASKGIDYLFVAPPHLH